MQTTEELIQQGEGQKIEFKSSFQKEVIETAVAFANAKGGKILIGVDDKGAIVGVDCNQESLQNWINQIKQNTAPALIPDISVEEIDGKKIVIIEVKEYPIKPVSFKNRYFVRKVNANHLMQLDEIANEHLKSINASWDYHIDTRHDFDDISMDKVIAMIDHIERYQGKKIHDDAWTILRKHELIKDDKLTFAAYLLFVNNSSPLTSIDIGRFKSETLIIDSLSLRNEGLIIPESMAQDFGFTGVLGKQAHSRLRNWFSSAAVKPKDKSDSGIIEFSFLNDPHINSSGKMFNK